MKFLMSMCCTKRKPSLPKLGEAATEFIKEYERVYTAFWCADYTNDRKEIGAVFEAEIIGKKFFGITQETFEFIRWKVEHTNHHEI